MSKQERGFTLIELMIVVAIIAIIASIAIPNLIAARINANESAAIATLKSINSAQAQCQASGVIDTNGNGAGEYGTFGELSGRQTIRGSNPARMITPAAMSSAFGNVAASRVLRSGYFFQLYLPDVNQAGVAEDATGGYTGAAIDAGEAESMWCCYAWPQSAGSSGNRTFFVSQAGEVLSTNPATPYSGTTTVPTWSAAVLGTVATPTMNSALAANAAGVDTNTWVVVN